MSWAIKKRLEHMRKVAAAAKRALRFIRYAPFVSIFAAGAAKYTGKPVKRSPLTGNKFILINKKACGEFSGVPDADARRHQNSLGLTAIVLDSQEG
jgi:hypothetical protein